MLTQGRYFVCQKGNLSPSYNKRIKAVVFLSSPKTAEFFSFPCQKIRKRKGFLLQSRRSDNTSFLLDLVETSTALPFPISKKWWFRVIAKQETPKLSLCKLEEKLFKALTFLCFVSNLKHSYHISGRTLKKFKDIAMVPVPLHALSFFTASLCF